jgi:transcription-repair coupling factor (superfamily II helicase)
LTPLIKQTNPSTELVDLSMRAAHEVLLTADTITQFCQQYRSFVGGSRTFPTDDPLYQHISEGRPYPGMEHWLPLFFEQTATLLDYISEQPNILFDDGVDIAIQHRLGAIDDYYKARLNPPLGDITAYNPIVPNLLYWQAADWQHFTETQSIIQLSPFKTDEAAFNLKIVPSFKAEREQSTTALFDTIDTYLSTNKSRNRIITCMSDGTRDRLLHMCEEHHILNIIPYDILPTDAVLGTVRLDETILVIAPFETGFESDRCVLLTEQYILGEKIRTLKTIKRKSDAFSKKSVSYPFMI